MIETEGYSIHLVPEDWEPLRAFLEARQYSRLMVLCDHHTEAECYPILKPFLPPHIKVRVAPGEDHKSLESATRIWKILTDQLFDRKACLLNLGGGMVGDLGGFIAANYKRGIDFVQIPTSLLAMVDASVGGKTGVNFGGYKNQLGAFRDPAAIFIYPPFLQTLPEKELVSGFAEMLKHGLISDAGHWQSLVALEKPLSPAALAPMITHSIRAKLAIVEQDPFEAGLRKALNFGHTLGHAIESYALKAGKEMRHGEAVALGMVAEAWIACHKRELLSPNELAEITTGILRYFAIPYASMQAWDEITDLARQDKKNADGQILLAVCGPIGQVHYDVPASRGEIFQALKYLFRDITQPN